MFSHCSVIATLVSTGSQSIRTTIILAPNSLIYAVIPEVTVPLTHKCFFFAGFYWKSSDTKSFSLFIIVVLLLCFVIFVSSDFNLFAIFFGTIPTTIKRINYRLYIFCSLNPKSNIKFDVLFHSVLCRTFLLLTYLTPFTQSTLRNVLPEFKLRFDVVQN